VAIERGSGASDGDCSTFVGAAPVFDGTLVGLEAVGRLDVGRVEDEGDALSFRFRFELVDVAGASERSGSAFIEWATRSP
jgi:hypothetical protein